MEVIEHPVDIDAAAGAVSLVLERGGVAVIPTDTVYGLAALPTQAAAIQRVFRLKRRPQDHRLPVIVGSMGDVDNLGVEFGQDARQLASAFWPGQLTIAVGVREPNVEWLVGRDEVGLRMPSSDLVRRVASLVGSFLLTSANTHGTDPGSTLVAALAGLAEEPDLAIDGGELSFVSSTLVNVNAQYPRIERQGAISAEAIAQVLGIE